MEWIESEVYESIEYKWKVFPVVRKNRSVCKNYKSYIFT